MKQKRKPAVKKRRRRIPKRKLIVSLKPPVPAEPAGMHILLEQRRQEQEQEERGMLERMYREAGPEARRGRARTTWPMGSSFRNAGLSGWVAGACRAYSITYDQATS